MANSPPIELVTYTKENGFTVEEAMRLCTEFQSGLLRSDSDGQDTSLAETSSFAAGQLAAPLSDFPPIDSATGNSEA